MPPGGTGKRKRGDRTFSQDGGHDGSRPSPHRPGNLSLAQHQNPGQGQYQQGYGREQYEQRGGGRRRASRGNRGSGSQRSPINSPNAMPVTSRTSVSGKVQSPPSTPTLSRKEPEQALAPQPASSSNTAMTQTSDPQQPPAVLYLYEYVTDERLRQWAQGGKKDIIDLAVKSQHDEDFLALGSLFQEVVRSGVEGRLEPLEAGGTIKDIIGSEIVTDSIAKSERSPPELDASSLFLDCLSIVAETSNIGPRWSPLLTATGLSPLLMRHRLDSSLLQSLGMIRSTFVRVGIRQQTNLLYRQSNYNLLREETEGYSKLITELFTTSSNESPSSTAVEETFERVKGMIGAFDLDVGRVLDVTLDVFAAVLVKHYRFFVKYLRVSSWWPQEIAHKNGVSESLPRWALPGSLTQSLSSEEEADLDTARDERDQAFWLIAKQKGIAAFFELGDRGVEASELQAAIDNNTEGSPLEQDEDRNWMKATGTLPPRGNKVAAQILGFKLRFYSSAARSPTDVLPVNLIYLAALLIKTGFISLRDLYPHLWPADEAMEAVREEKMREKVDKEKLNRPGGGAPNALTSAGALPDDMPPPTRLRESDRVREAELSRNSPAKADTTTEKAGPTADMEDKEQLPEPSDQKVQLLKSLLCIGALPEALYILGRFPWIPDAFPELPEHIHRILHYSLSKVYAPVRPLREHVELREPQKEPDADQAGVAKGYLKLADAPPRKVLRWAQLDKDDTNEGIDYRFYWDDWADNVPICQSVDDVFTLCATFLNCSGVKIGQDPGLLLKLARIGSHSLSTDPSEANKARWVDLSKRLIVPALSLTKCLPGVVNEVFELLIKNFPTMTRFSIYAEWYQGPTSRLPDIQTAFEQVKSETKDILKRISKTNVKPMARSLARIAYSSPGIVFQVAIAQIESYDNLVETVVECARYFTYLSYDVLTWSILSSLGGPGRMRVQQDGMLTSRWLSALSLFAGKVFRRYSVMGATPILQYVAEQLRQSNPTDLIVLEQITSSMAGIVSDTNFNEAQVLAMAGGELLQAQTMLQLLDRRHESKTTAKRLLHFLTRPRLAGQLLVLIAQERQTCVYKIPERNAHLKLLGNLFDELHRVFVQYLDLLRSNLTIQEFDELVPSVSRLIIDFGIEPNVAFAIARPSIAAAISAYDANVPKVPYEPKKSPLQEPADGAVKVDIQGSSGETKLDTENTTIDSDPADQVASLQVSDGVEPMDVDVVHAGSLEAAPIDPSASPAAPVKPHWHPVLQDVMDNIASALPDETWDVLSRPFFVTFWSLSLGDMSVPSNSYDEEINRQKKKVAAINNDRSDLSVLGTQRKDREKKALGDLQDRLRAEFKSQIQAYSLTRTRLSEEKDLWFAGLSLKKNALNAALLEQCFLPRILLSPIDAMYSFKMFKFLHSSGATNFWSMGFLDQIFGEKRLTSILFLCTAKEAEHLGRFLSEILRDLNRWHVDKATFEKEAYGPKKDLPGFVHKQEKETLGFLPYEGFRSLLFKWHRQLFIALKTCFTGGEYMHIRNAINVQKAVHQTFPAIDWMGDKLVTFITSLSKDEPREDLKIAATSLLGNLKRREKDWVLQNAFGTVGTPKGAVKANGSNGQRSTSPKSGASHPGSSAAKDLNPRAADFRPTGSSSTDGSAEHMNRVAGEAQPDAEDGEIEDAKRADVTAKADKLAADNVKIVDGKDVPSPPPAVPAKALETDITLEPNQRSQTPKPVSRESDRVPTPAAVMQMKSQLQDTIPTSVVARTSSPIPPRPEAPRSSSSSGVNGRVQHGLPNRPDLPNSRVGEHRVVNKEHMSHDHSKDRRYPERGGMDGSRDSIHERAPDRQFAPSQQRSYERPERLQNAERDPGPIGWGGDKGTSGRPNAEEWQNGVTQTRDSRQPQRVERMDRLQRDRAGAEMNLNSRTFEPQGQTNREGVMAPPRSNIPQHPDRAALIHGATERDRPPFDQQHDRRQESRRYESHPISDRLSRPGSPTRLDDRQHQRFEPRRDDRPPVHARQTQENTANGRLPRYEDNHAPTGPRTDRPMPGSQGSPQDRFRDSTRNGFTPSPATDPYRRDQNMTHNNRQHESQYGRLNAGPEIPLGPRLPNGNTAPPPRATGRNVSAPQPANTPQTQSHSGSQNGSIASQEKHTPTGPSARGPSMAAPPLPRPDSVQSAPPTPVTESPDTAGVHPDRLRAIQGAGAAPGPAASSSTIMGRPPREPLPPVSVPSSPGQRPHAQIPSPGGHMQSPLGPSPSPRGAPTGPSFGNDNRRGDKRMLAGIQNALQQAGTLNPPERSGQGASIRGRGGRANNNALSSPSASGPPTNAAHTPPQDTFPSRGDLFANRPPPHSVQQHPEVEADHGRGARRGGPREPMKEPPRDAVRDGARGSVSTRDEARNEERRPIHHHSSRDHSRDTGPLLPSMPPRDDDRLPRRNDLRDRGRPPIPPPPMERDMRRPPRMDEQRRAESDRREMESWGGDRRNGMERRDDRDRRDGGGSGRKRGRAGEDGRDDNKRPRRSG